MAPLKSNYQHSSLVNSLVIKGKSPIGSSPSNQPKRTLTADDLAEIIDDGIAKKYKVYGGLYFFEFDIQGIVNLCNRKISFPIYFEHCIFHDFLELWCSEFRTLSFSGSTLLAGADLRSSTFNGGLFLRNGFSCEGPLLLRDITVTQAIDIQKASFLFDGHHHALPDGNECISLSRAKANALYWKSLSQKPKGKVNLRDVSVTSFQNDIEADEQLKNWPDKGLLTLDGFQCENMTDASPNQSLKWLNLQSELTIGSLSNIARIYSKQHQTHNQKKIIAEIRKKEISQIRQPVIRWAHRIFFSLIGYGTAPHRALYALIAAIGIHFIALVGIANTNGIEPNINEMLSDPCFLGLSDVCPSVARYNEVQVLLNGGIATRYVPQQYPEFDPLLFTTESFLPFIDTGQKRYWQVGDVLLRVILSTFSPAAFFLSGLFIGGISGLLDRKV